MQQLAKDILASLETKMTQAQEVMLKNFCDIRTGTANPNILDKITVNYYGAPTFLKTLASISVSEGNQLNIKPYDSTLIPNIKKVFLSSNLGITPQTDGVVVRLVFPKPTEERRKALMKEVEQLAEKTKVAIRNVRREGNDKIKKVELTKDLETFYLNQIQTLTDKNIKLIEKHTTTKNTELLKA
ncbi:ribosome-recycling factor [Hydrangea phyllody phytoplasma]|uniref:Ribosome-recycling factor n=3 Tax=16SrI (Aster yellows group) TaxID=3042590 RepID=A0ABQ5PSR2_9MOLU|nr:MULTISPECIES: ribosome recycling factor [16SrI (Aster yellows group)]MBS2993843.1 ribosome recycling factor ['Santalum album' aster yellows phytoplasma]GFZ75127.1 ribosome-recycling factor [Hydrangea phyllody phytoplasma]GLH61294.1 ribosome-recycling factor [Rhus yellows phytoplasma]GLH61677.1 ribosome-recycling factor [Hydrangea phyllody phytoplasma]